VGGTSGLERVIETAARLGEKKLVVCSSRGMLDSDERNPPRIAAK
jgi:hypothetical protein